MSMHFAPRARLTWSPLTHRWTAVRATPAIAGASTAGAPPASPAWVPPADLREEDTRFVLTVDLPGVSREDVALTLEDGVLTLSGERRAAGDEATATAPARHQERRHGGFRRSFRLPRTADASAVTARAVNGVLEVVVPKLATSQPRRIDVAA